MDVIGPVTYQINLPESWKIHNIFHASLLRQYKETEVYGANYPRPPPEIEGEEVYEVKSILKHHRRGRGYQFFVKWSGYPISKASWEPEHVFSEDGNLLKCYKEQPHITLSLTTTWFQHN